MPPGPRRRSTLAVRQAWAVMLRIQPKTSSWVPLSARATVSLSSFATEGDHLSRFSAQPRYQLITLLPALVGAASTINFFLSEAIMGQHFDVVELEGEPQLGDLFLFKLSSPKTQWCGAHVGVYCGDGEIIHFEGKKTGASELQKILGEWEGVVSKQGRRPLLRSRSLWRVLRRRGGVDPVVLERRVREAMNADPPPYHPTRSNCVHFALRLLGADSVSVDVDLTKD